ncbi:mitochondrial pyruvate carrier NDAI_0B01000 [Naumovozyma dairenensis CBS 421]|uniref:Mitochondrial pyruvate carrier n=1 Tax=Naumovozyma dairenensis (strain ATCC 10597 / BCRC 20456 / CBS 421 / NBRC 0211 / NRRL Y-12639) TaxID=1071378 RepID=G0W5S3_NAUDC|nr:hypothetical protein NDAI_0B01000 [Naumovozyma dairenensis CBS 421]CCD23134.1 hypothetical protein NDAI_0B01000 [Naumovozyma dairenensis CBS 421]
MSAARSTIGTTFKRFWNSQTGPKTVHFWAPTLKWSLVIAGLNDMQRPVDTLSGTQNLSLLATGLVWTRWSFVITPRNYLLASVNFFLAGVAGTQMTRIIKYRLENGDSKMQVLNYIVNGTTSKNKGDMNIMTHDDKSSNNVLVTHS